MGCVTFAIKRYSLSFGEIPRQNSDLRPCKVKADDYCLSNMVFLPEALIRWSISKIADFM